jgi:MFS family permease
MLTGVAKGNAMKRKAWLITALMTACFTLSYVDRHVIGLLIDPIKKSLSLSDTQIGLIQGISFSLFYVMATLPLARISDRGNRPRVISTCIAAWSLMTMACGMASSFWQLLLARVGVAVGEAGLPPAALTMMADLHDAKALARSTSLFMLAPFLGGGIALMGGGALYGATAGWHMPVIGGMAPLERWQVVFMMVGAPGLIAAALVLFIAEPAPDRSKAAASKGFSELFVFLRRNGMANAGYFLAIALMSLLLNAYVSWLPAALMRAQNLDAKTIGMLFGPIFLIAGSAGTLVAGLVVGRSADDVVMRTFRFMRTCVLVALPAALIGPLLHDLRMQLAVLTVAIFCISAVLGLSSLPLQFLAPKHLRAQSIAFLGLIAALVGTGLGPLLVGLLSDVLGSAEHPLSMSLTIVGGAAALLAVGMLHLALQRPSHPPASEHRAGLKLDTAPETP